MRLFAVLMVTLFGTIAAAQTLPERFMVTDVASDDTLNIRAEPDATSDIIGEFGPNTLNVEILRVQEGWGQVPTAEGLGWVSMRFLAENPWPEGEVPRPLACSGTEPFWSLTLHANEQQTNPLTIDTNASYSNLGEDNGVARTACPRPCSTEPVMAIASKPDVARCR